MDQGEVGFLHATLFEGLAHFLGGVAVGCKKNDSRGRLIEAMDDVNDFPQLIAKDLHRDPVFRLGLVGSMNEVARGFVNRDQPIVLKEDGEIPHFRLSWSKIA